MVQELVQYYMKTLMLLLLRECLCTCFLFGTYSLYGCVVCFLLHLAITIVSLGNTKRDLVAYPITLFCFLLIIKCNQVSLSSV